MLGMYVHTHWGYNHPYAARTWTLEDWRGYLSGLQQLGYDLVMFWPLVDSMPALPTPSDLAFLQRTAQVIDMAHDEFGMKFLITLGPNVMGNARAADYRYEDRPFFICEHKVNPSDPASVKAMLEARKWQLEPLHKADGLVIIDGDPGGYIGSSDAQFVDLIQGQIDVFRHFNPSAELIYWMWMGWENYNRFWAEANQLPEEQAEPDLHIELPTFLNVLNGLRERVAEPWSLMGAWPQHIQAVQQLGLMDRQMRIPYGAVEYEPSFPLTNYTPAELKAVFTQKPAGTFPRGTMANSQSHCLQLPHAYLFSRYAQDAEVDLRSFADGLILEAGSQVCAGWEAIPGSPDQQEAAAGALRPEIGKPHTLGAYAGLLFGDADRFLTDLADNLEIRASLSRLQQAIAAGHAPAIRTAVQLVLARLRPYQQRTGFIDAYMGPLDELLNVPLARLGDAGLNQVLRQFHNWRNPSVRNGLVPSLLDALEKYSRN